MAIHNPEAGKCWGVLRKIHGYCLKHARPGKLTCHHHRGDERAAQVLKEKLEKDKADAGQNPPS